MEKKYYIQFVYNGKPEELWFDNLDEIRPTDHQITLEDAIANIIDLHISSGKPVEGEKVKNIVLYGKDGEVIAVYNPK